MEGGNQCESEEEDGEREGEFFEGRHEVNLRRKGEFWEVPVWGMLGSRVSVESGRARRVQCERGTRCPVGTGRW